MTVDQLIYSMSRQIENNFQSFYTVAEDVVGEEKALEIAKQIGLRYGGGGYATFLPPKAALRVRERRMMALYQDLVHSLRGPKHAAGAVRHPRRVALRRQAQGVHLLQRARSGERQVCGCVRGRMLRGLRNADRNLLRVEVHKCRWMGNDRLRAALGRIANDPAVNTADQ